MKKLIKTSFSIFAMLAVVVTFSLQQVNAAEKIRWKVQSTFNTGWPALGAVSYTHLTLPTKRIV